MYFWLVTLIIIVKKRSRPITSQCGGLLAVLLCLFGRNDNSSPHPAEVGIVFPQTLKVRSSFVVEYDILLRSAEIVRIRLT
jgi:hypothetical protein